ncbi:hypothetical protein BK369_15810 [Escherichia coli]|nr:hypothetical protein BK250_15965 [Escherichia coli]BBM62185.1 UDP-N-acetylglucosamine 4-epimerase [Escherichia albertii]OJK98530.1 hypothetical protein BK253_24535 [Escherichia coli]OJN06433.1 hypothetical protein BK295_18370 [Escherichia coli]OJN29119.1 hypothetical protein BK297_11080 [Escherichia coli]
MIYFFIYSDFRLNLYISLAKAYERKGYEIFFVVQDTLSLSKLKRTKFKKRLIEFPYYKNKKLSRSNLEHYKDRLKMNTDVLSKNIGLEQSAYLYHCMVDFIIKLNPDSETIFFAGNGVHVQDIALKDLKSKYAYRTVFTELANIDNRVFFDPIGSNCHSLFYKMDELDNYYKGESESHEKWKAEYIKNKIEMHIVRQAKRMSILDKVRYYKSTLIDLLRNRPSYPALRIRSGYTKYKIFGKKETHKSGEIPRLNYCNDLPENYLFFPLQVTNDAQILINSNYDNYLALDYYKQQAEKNGLELVVKIHPAERNIDFIKNIVEKSKTKGFYLSNENTFSLIINSQQVGVNNSTVGFESIICNKETTFLGKTFYSKLLDDEWFGFYIFNYLFKADFFSGEIYETDVIGKISFYFNLEDNFYMSQKRNIRFDEQ